jgi:alpha-galactosidase
MSIWSLMASPLIISADLSQLDDTTKSLLMNDDVLAVDQDALGQAATRVGETRNGAQVWARPLKDGSFAVGLFNLNNTAMNIVTDLHEIGFHETGNLVVKDLWKNQVRALTGESLGGMVPAHGVLLLKISRQ